MCVDLLFVVNRVFVFWTSTLCLIPRHMVPSWHQIVMPKGLGAIQNRESSVIFFFRQSKGNTEQLIVKLVRVQLGFLYCSITNYPRLWRGRMIL